MTHILHITASAHLETSASRAASATVVANLGGSVTERNLAADPLPFVTREWADARLTDPATRNAAETAILALSDTLIAELRAADTIVVGTPIYNFAAPAVLKAWMDMVARPRETFTYTAEGPKGLLDGKKAIIVVSSGGVPIGYELDFLTSHLRFFLGFIGITDVEIHTAVDINPAV